MRARKTSGMRLKLRRAKHPNAPIPKVDDLRCPSGKFPFLNAAAARKASAHLATQGRHTKPYACRHCNRWHLTSVQQHARPA